MNSMFVPVMQGYFRVMGNRLLAGREFTEADIRGNANLAIVQNQATSDTVWTATGTADAVGINWSLQAFAVCSLVTP